MNATPLPASPAARRRMTVQGIFHTVLVLMGALVIIGTALGASLLGRTAQVSDELLDRIQPARAEAYRLQAALVSQETGARGYAITADRQFLTPYTQGKKDEKATAARLRALISDRKQLADDLRAIEDAAAAWRRANTERLIDGVTPGTPRTVDKAAAERGERAFDHIRGLFEVQNTHLQQAREDEHADLAHVRAVRNWVLVGMVTAFLLTATVLAVLVRVLVTRPLSTLRASSRRVADGDFGHCIAAEGPADIRAVAEDVEGMRRRIVAELNASRTQQERLAEQAADLDAQAVELRRSNAELEQFAYVASHDLQEPLRKIASFCQLLEKRYGQHLDDRGKQYIGFAVDGAKRMQVLISDLLTFSRVGRLNDAHVLLALDKTLDKALVNLTAAVEESGVRVERPEQLPEITGDPALLTMLWQNLIGNAVKFRHPDRPPVVTITCGPDPDGGQGVWQLCVADNGIGIPGEFTEKVFVIFQRLHARDAYTGTGIGLALCKKIVDYHGGRIWIDTAHSSGTRLCFTLPAAPTPAAEEDTPTGTGRVLEGNPA
ncbi:CHASE3 domain-containing protein [Streptomyces sp. ISL-112]|uniref:sensor histidine kinase n=1 Tax=unclassified Streptomyces TaxID=2593676 RepID=UPI001BE95DD5|nr:MULTISPECIES: sensor histidine kinase [unclassified Streptomyces]MBT2429549.1 CHASE3 domain-containing protein [Streptomyces sp. ISL-112]MBT2462820.1 CHASE3 domain-containing protein [Streptomyces sp. ISL-63]